MKKILILTGSYGSGHNAAAQALKNTAEISGNKVDIIDMVEFLQKFMLGKSSKNFYEEFCEQYPKVWEFSYNIMDHKNVKRLLFGVRYPIFQEKFDTYIDKFQPDEIISVFPFWGGFIKKNIQKYGKKYITKIVITDAIEIHSLWYVTGNYVDYYYVLDICTKNKFQSKFSHNSDNVIVSFFPIEEKYFLDRKNNPGKRIFFILSGISKKFAQDCLKSIEKYPDLQVTILQGRKRKLFLYLKKEFPENHQRIYQEYIPIQEQLQTIDIVIGKPGGAILSETLAADIPMLIPSYTPGQEKGNLELVLNEELGVYEKNGKKIGFSLSYTYWNKILKNIRTLKKKESCHIILK